MLKSLSIKDVGNLNPQWWVLLAVSFGSFMAALDDSVVNTVLPVMNYALNSDLAAIEWVVTIYLLVISGTLVSFGRLGDLHGHKPVYISGLVVFVISSVLCSLAPTVIALIAFRALQGLGGAMLIANAPAVLTKNFPSTQRGQVLGLQATMTYLGLTLGPTLGGWLTDQFSWRAIFYVNLPVGLFALLLSLRFIPHEEAPKEHTEQFDFIGAVTFMLGLVAVLLVLNQGPTWGWTSLANLSLLVMAVLLLGAFLMIEWYVPHPLLDLRLFQHRLFAVATASSVINFICLFSILFLLPFYLIQGRGLSSVQAGLLIIAQPLLMAVVAPLSGMLSDRIGSQSLATLGMTLLTFGLFFLSRLGSESPLSYVVVALGIAGLGFGLFISPNNSTLMGAAPSNQQGSAAGIMATARNVGMVLGVGLAGAILTTVLVHVQASRSANALFEAVNISFLMTTGVAALGVLISIFR